MVDPPKWWLGVWVASLDVFFKNKIKTFCEHAPQNQLCKSTIFIIFGPTDQKLWSNELLGRSLDKVGKCRSQPARIDYMCPKMWTGGRREILQGEKMGTCTREVGERWLLVGPGCPTSDCRPLIACLQMTSGRGTSWMGAGSQHPLVICPWVTSG
jgi:hypothetical protein